jgi:hypothetical protein
LLYIEVDKEGDENANEEWQNAVNELITSALTSALAIKRERFFCQNQFNYIGQQLDGEYWFGNTRFAPAWPNDDQPAMFNAERVVSIDQIIYAIDRNDSYSLAQQSSSRLAARLSLLLDAGLYRTPLEQRWVYRDGKSIRASLAFVGYAAPLVDIPQKGEVCRLGRWAGSLTSRYTGDLLSLPREARKILRAIDSASPMVIDAFDRGARLYQVAAVIQQQFPSVSLAYRVAAVEAISKADPTGNGFSEFMRKNVKSLSDPDPVLDFLYGTARSGHFHAGEFPLGEHDRSELIPAFMSSEYVEKTNLVRVSFAITREAIINWLAGQLPYQEAAQESES